MLLVACAIFVPRLKGDTAGHINSSHRGETLRDERPYRPTLNSIRQTDVDTLMIRT